MSQDSTEKKLNVLLTGNDERINLSKGYTKHFINPSEVTDDINRGNCTCSSLSAAAEEVVAQYELEIAEKGFNACWEGVRNDISQLFTGDNTVFLAPSGSHLSYFPLLHHVLVNPNQKIVSIVSCSNELGSGTEKAYHGDIFFEFNQFGEQSSKKTIGSQVTSFHLSARDTDGEIINNYDNIKNLIEKHIGSSQVIVNLSAGSKSGLKDDFSIIDDYPNVTWVLDACQYRIDQNVLNGLVAKGVLVFITGSKFYEAPPYCGAMIVRKSFGSQMNNSLSISNKAFFQEIFSQNDFPEDLDILRSSFKQFNNEGLLYKWGIALSNIKRLSAFESNEVTDAIGRWNAELLMHIDKHRDFIKLIPTQGSACKSILSFTLFTQKGKQLSFEQLNDLRALLAKDNDFQINDKNILIGQPVKYGDKAFIRIALGVHGVCDLLEGQQTIVIEKSILDMLVSMLKEKF